MKVIITILTLFFIKLTGFSQDREIYIRCEMYIYSWTSFPRLPITDENIKEYYQIKIDNKRLKSECFCRTYSSLREQLLSGEILESESLGNLNALVEITFAGENQINKTISIGFDKDGNYYFEKKWYSINKLIYFYLFEFFNNTLIKESVLESIKKEIEKNNICWRLKTNKE